MEQVWPSRLRWRLRGAWQWPVFGALVVADAVVLHELPIAGDTGPGMFGALLLSLLFNLLAVAFLAPLGGMALRRRRPDLPKVVASDYAGTVAVLLVTVTVVAVGVAHHPSAQADRAALVDGVARVRMYVAHNAPAEFRRHLDQITSMRFSDTLYRTCVPGDSPRRALCMFVSTDESPPGLRLDPNRAPNSTFLPPP